MNRSNDSDKPRSFGFKNTVRTTELPFQNVFKYSEHSQKLSTYGDQSASNFSTADENCLSATNSFKVDLETNSVIHYSIYHSPNQANVPTIQPSAFIPSFSDSNEELNLKLLNVYLALLITDVCFQDKSISSAETKYKDRSKKIGSKMETKMCRRKTREIVKMTVYVDQIIQTIDKFMSYQFSSGEPLFMKCSDQEKEIFGKQIVSILRSLILEYVPTTDAHPLSRLFRESLKRAHHLQTNTGYSKHRRFSRIEKDSTLLKKLEGLCHVPPTLLNSLNFGISMPQYGQNFESYREQIEAVEKLLLVYVIFLLEMKKLFEVTVAIARTSGVQVMVDHHLFLECLEAFLYSSVICRNAELIVGLDKLIKQWTQDDDQMKRLTKVWASNLIDHWDCSGIRRAKNDVAQNCDSRNYNAYSPIICEYDLVKLFVNEVIDICDENTVVPPSVTVKPSGSGPPSEFRWLTIFENDADNRISSIETCEIETFVSTDKADIDPRIWHAPTNVYDTKIAKRHHSDSRRHNLRTWFRSLHSNDLGSRHKFLDKCHRAKCKVTRLVERLSFRSGTHRQDANRFKGSCYTDEQEDLSERSLRTSHGTKKRPKRSATGQVQVMFHSAGKKQEQITSLQDGTRFEDLFDRTTFSDLITECNRYERFKNKKKRFMFLFFGEEA